MKRTFHTKGWGGRFACPKANLFFIAAAHTAQAAQWCSPTSLTATKDGAQIYIACATSNQLQIYDTASSRISRTIALPAPASGVALSLKEDQLYVTIPSTKSTVRIIEASSGRPVATIPTAHTTLAPVLSPDGKTLYVVNRFNDEVAVIDLAARKQTTRIPMVREPADAALTPDGKHLIVANALPAGRADKPPIAAEVTIVDTQSLTASAHIVLPNGSTSLRAVRISPDGRHAVVTHSLSRYYLPSTQIERGWIQTNAITLIDVAQSQRLATVLLDEVDRGAANPWGVAWSVDGSTLLVTQAGTHEVSAINFPDLLAKLPDSDPSGDLSFLAGIRRRIPLQGNGPRAIVTTAAHTYVASYFSDTLESIDRSAVASMAARLSPQQVPDQIRKGERLFNDGAISFQGWLSCNSCHSPDARVDALNWDLLNDGIGNPKNAKSLLLAHRTPPAMWHGIRETAEIAVRAGIRNILFTQRPEDDATAIDVFLKSLKPLPSPHLVDGKLSPAAQRGRRIFNDTKVACARCHPAGLYTDLKSYDVGTCGKTDESAQFDTPTLIETWRTGPYLHDGSAATMRDVVTTSNLGDKHGATSHLKPNEIDDLIAYLLSL